MTLNEELTKLAVDSYDKGVNDAKQSAMEVFAIAIDLARADEREACAKVCENIYEGDEACGDWPSPEQCAEAIRARGNT